MNAPQLRRTIGPITAIMITVGSVIGSGIFMKPLDIAISLPSETWVYGCWLGLGLVCLSGALSYAELGAMFPEAGGQYAFLREGFGRLPAFLYGWCLFFVLNTGTMAALAVVFGQAVAKLIPMGSVAQAGLSVAMVLVLATFNHVGVGVGALLQNLSTFAKVLALLVIVVAGFLIGDSSSDPTGFGAAGEYQTSLVAGLVAAAVAIFWAYEGWYQLAFNAAEMTQPKRVLPIGLIVGLMVLVSLYMLVNAAYLHLVPIQEMRTLTEDVEVPRLAMRRIFGAPGENILTMFICLSVFGAANPNMLSTPRAFFAMAKDGAAVRPLMYVDRRFQTPTVAIWSQALWAIGLIVVLKTFRDITEYVVFASLIFYALTVAAVYRLRKKDPTRERPFRCPGYPITPALFICAALFVDLYILTEPAEQKNALYGLAIIALGVPAYFVLQRYNKGKGKANSN